MWYAFGIIFIPILSFLLLRLRIRLELSDTRRVLFMGIGRSGAEINFLESITRVKLMGMTIRTMKAQNKETESDGSNNAIRPVSLDKRKQTDSHQPTRKRTRTRIIDWLEIGSQVFRTLSKYVGELFRSIRVEEAEAEIHAGFESPHLTGETYGYYHALIGAVPSLAPRLRFYPDWTGQSFSGSARLSIAIPMYALVGRTIMMLCRLPLFRIMKTIRKQRKGAVYAN